MIHLDSFFHVHELFYINSSLLQDKPEMTNHIGFCRDSTANNDIIQNLLQRPSSFSHNTAFFFFLTMFNSWKNAEKLQMKSLLKSIFRWAFVRENPLVGTYFGVKFLPRLTKFAHIKHVCEQPPLSNGIHFAYHTDQDHLSWTCPLHDPDLEGKRDSKIFSGP